MVRRLLVLGVVVLLVGGGLAYAGGYGPAPGDDGDDLTAFPTETADGGVATATSDGSDGSTDGGDGSTAGTATPVERPFAVAIESVEECGRTCRDVTVSLVNRQSTAAEDVTVYTRVFAGNSTDESDQVWSGTESVGRLGGGETYTTTKRVKLSYGEAYAVEQADGWITVQTTIETADRTVTFTQRRQVA